MPQFAPDIKIGLNIVLKCHISFTSQFVIIYLYYIMNIDSCSEFNDFLKVLCTL